MHVNALSLSLSSLSLSLSSLSLSLSSSLSLSLVGEGSHATSTRGRYFPYIYTLCTVYCCAAAWEKVEFSLTEKFERVFVSDRRIVTVFFYCVVKPEN
jgi:hypothetical protein